jgi:hypothetical protein
MKIEGQGVTGLYPYRWMFVSECVIDRHIVEERHNVLFEENLNHCEVEARIHEYGSEISFEHVRKTLDYCCVSQWDMLVLRATHFGRVRCRKPIVHVPFTLILCRLQLFCIDGDLLNQRIAEVLKMNMKAQLNS